MPKGIFKRSEIDKKNRSLLWIKKWQDPIFKDRRSKEIKKGCKNRKSYKGKNNPMWKGGLIIWKCINCGKERLVFKSCQTKRCRTCYLKILGLRVKKKHPCVGKHWTQSEQTKNKHRKILKEKWQDPVYKEKTIKNILKASHKRPNTVEIFLDIFFQKNLANEYKYVGNGEFILGGKCPDFMNINGKKKLIELYGDYWHGKERTGKIKKEAEDERINHFKKFGFNTLIIWESELKNLLKLKQKVLIFNKKT